MSPREENSPKVTSQQGAEVLWEPSPTPSPCRQGSWSFGGELHSAFPVSSLDLTASEGGGAGRGAGGGSGSQRACAPGASPAACGPISDSTAAETPLSFHSGSLSLHHISASLRWGWSGHGRCWGLYRETAVGIHIVWT